MKRFALGAVAGLAVGMLVTKLAMSSSPAEPPRPASAASGDCAGSVTADDLEALGDELRAELRAARSPSSAPAAPAATAPVEADAPSPESAQAAADADELVERAIAAGRWTESDVAKLRMLQGQLAPDDLARILGTVTTAINEQVLVSTTPRIL